MFGRTLAHARRIYPNRADLHLRICLIVDAESDCRVLANGGGGKTLNAQQREVLKASIGILAVMGWPKEWVGNDGVSVGPTQASPTEATRLAAQPWAGWGRIDQCMDIDYIIPKTLGELAFRPTTTDVVADCWWTQRWTTTRPDVDNAAFHQAAQTLNYSRRLATVRNRVANWHDRWFSDGGQ